MAKLTACTEIGSITARDSDAEFPDCIDRSNPCFGPGSRSRASLNVAAVIPEQMALKLLGESHAPRIPYLTRHEAKRKVSTEHQRRQH